MNFWPTRQTLIFPLPPPPLAPPLFPPPPLLPLLRFAMNDFSSACVRRFCRGGAVYAARAARRKMGEAG
jgi:hypothetical protein